MRDIETDRDRRNAVANSPIRSHDRRKGRDRGQRIIDRVLLATEAEHGRGHSQRIHGWHSGGGRFVKDLNGGAGERSPSRQILRESRALRVIRQAAVEQQVGHLLERGVRSQVFDGIPGDGQPARLPIDVAESCRCGDDVFQALSHDSHVWGAREGLSILIVESI